MSVKDDFVLPVGKDFYSIMNFIVPTYIKGQHIKLSVCCVSGRAIAVHSSYPCSISETASSFGRITRSLRKLWGCPRSNGFASPELF